MHHLHDSKNSSSLTKPAHWSRALLAVSLASVFAASQAGAQTYFNLSTGTYNETFTDISTWVSPTTGSWSGLAVGGSTTIPEATKITAQTTGFQGTGGQGSSSSSGVQRPTTNLQLLTTGTTNSAAMDLNLNFQGRNSGNLSFNAATVFNSTGNQKSTLRLYYSTNGTSWTEITGTGLPIVATNNVAASASINVPIPTAVDNQSQVKIRFYLYSSTGGSSGSRPKVSIDDVSVTSSSSGAADTTAPLLATLSPLSPSNAATNVAIGSNLVANFNEVIAAGTGNIVIKKTSDSSVFATIPVGDPQVTVSGSTLTINPTANLAANTAYYVNIASTAIKDAANNYFAGITNDTTWAFTTDATAPTVASFSPVAAATAATPSNTLKMNFSEDVNSVLGKYISVKKSDGTLVQILEASAFDGVVVSGAVATITLTNPLEYGVSYYVEVDPGTFEDLSGLAFAGIAGSTTWAFTTVNVPNLTTGAGYAQDFSTFVSMATLPLGWSLSGVTTTYLGTWAAGTSAGALGGETVFGYQHTSSTGTVLQTLTLRNATAETITDLVVSYKGRVARATETRIPIYTVRVGGSIITALAYSTADGDNITRTATLSGLTIAPGTTFQIEWSSDRGLSAGSSRQIGISTASVAIGVAQFAPSVSDSVSLASVSYNAATLSGTIVSDGASVITSRGFVYAATATNAAPAIGGTGVTTTIDDLVDNDPFSKVIVGLLPATGYTMRAYATNAIGTSYGPAVTFTTLATPPTFVTSYTQAFDAYNGSNPAGWSAVSSGGVQGYAGAWGNSAGTAGFTGGASAPGVLGYQHTSGTGTLTTKLTLINGTGSVLNNLTISYLGQASRTTEGRSPTFVVSVNGVEVPALAYSTLGNANLTVTADLTSLEIATGAPFTITWVSDRGAGSNSSKQIGIGTVAVSLASANTYASWATANGVTGGFNGDSNSDGVPNGVAYFYGATGSAVVANPQLVNNKVTYPIDATATGATGVIQTSTDLVTWSPQTSNTSVPGFISYTLPTGQGKIFVRLSVTQVTP
ncbi:MAG: Ig-like domain-containing protein [Akkermansiaceae bacterium]|nr:Ig-like domain-containing protein [Akkermansiaceae bacterium]